MRFRSTASLLRPVAVLGLSLSLLVGCSDDSPPDAAGDGTTTTGPIQTGESPECLQEPTMDPVEAEPVPGVDTDLTLTSFDGTEIRLHWFPAPGASADAPAPTVLKGPGWSLPGDVDIDGGALFGALSIRAMHDEGYNVLTWDPRGFGESTGQAQVNDPDHEGRDAQVLLDWVAAQPEALLDRPGDPRAGMVGFSYGGGIQLTLAGMDCRVDALVPGIAWNSLVNSLGRGETLKEGWAGMLVGLVDPDRVASEVVSAFEEGSTTATVSDEARAWFDARGPGDDIDLVNVPTFLVQGTVDTLFTPDEAVTNYRSLRQRGVPVKMMWFCGGHGVCLTEPGDDARITEATLAWLARHLKQDESVDTGPAVDIVDQDGVRWIADDYPTESISFVESSGAGSLDLVPEGGSGPLTQAAPAGDIVGSLVPDFTPARATNAVEVVITTDSPTLVVGAPSLTLAYSGTSPDGLKPTRVFAQLVDDDRDVVLGNQVTPIEVILDGTTQTVTVPLEAVAHHLDAGSSVTLQLVATTTAYSEPRMGGQIDFASVEVALPAPAGFSPN